MAFDRTGHASTHRQRVLLGLSLVAFGAAPAQAQSAAERSAWTEWCRQQGGHVQVTSSNPICVPPDQAPSSSSGYTASQQAMLDVAGQLGFALGQAIRQSFIASQQQAEAQRRQAEIQRMEAEWARRQAEIRRRERAQALLASMRGRVGAGDELRMRGVGALDGAQATANNSELALNRVETHTLRLRTSDEMFETGASSGTTTHDAVVAGRVDAGGTPNEVEGRPVGPDQSQAARQAWDDYLASLQRRDAAQRALAAAQAEREVSTRVRQEATHNAQEVRATVSAIPPSAPSAQRVEADNSLAEAERLLAEAIRLDEQAGRNLEDAHDGLQDAERQLAEAVTRRDAAEGGAAPAPATTP